jgi:hypothetical protein
MEAAKTWKEILDFVADVTPYLTTGALLWRIIDKVAEYSSAGREAKLRDIAKEEMKPLADMLSTQIKDLSAAIWALQNKK